VVLRTVRGENGGEDAAFVPHLAVAGAVALALAAVGLLIYYVHHIALALQVSEITNRIAHELEQAITALYPERIGEASQPPTRDPPPVPESAYWVAAAASGYVQAVDAEGSLRLARELDATIWLTARPGDFVVAGRRIAAASPVAEADRERCARDLRRAYELGNDRTAEQDAAFPIQQLVEIALRALSPGANEPFTAITAIDRLGQGLSLLALRGLPSAGRVDDGVVRIVTAPRTFVELLAAAFEPIALHCDNESAVLAHLLETMARLAAVVHRPEDRAALERLLDFVAIAAGAVTHAHRRARLAEGQAQVRRALADAAAWR
jgi:uncharacterized membrane protein